MARPRRDDNKRLKPVSIGIDEERIKKAERIGYGNVSLGVRVALDSYKERK